VLIGVISNNPDGQSDCDQAYSNSVVRLETLYPGSRVNAEKPGWFSGDRITPLSPSHFKLPKGAWPDFNRTSLTYPVENGMYGPMRAEVFPSNDGRLWWTYHVQTRSNRAWVAHVHLKDSAPKDTGLPQQIVDVGHTIPLAPYEYYHALTGTWLANRVGGTPYVDIWKKYTSRQPLVKAYYEARYRPVPQ